MSKVMTMRDGKWGEEEVVDITPCNANYQEPAPVEVVPVRTKKILQKQMRENLETEKRKKQK